ncbi:MAG: 4Fe-4S dicluster domain-containing protein [Syntrophotaleaceae bacterium]
MDRRQFLQMLGLASGAAALSSCGSDTGQKELVSLLVPAEDGIVPGTESWRPSTCGECPAHCGLLTRIREQRPVKLEGNPDHPVNRGGLCPRGQAALWRLYHPQRLQTPLRRQANGRFAEIGWPQALTEISDALQQSRQQGRQNAWLAGRSSGTLDSLLNEFCSALHIDRLAEFEPFSHAALRQAYQLLFGRNELPRYRVDQADLLLTVGADLLETFVSPVDYTAQVSARTADHRAHWLHLEPHYSLTGANADQRLVLHPGSEAQLLLWLLKTQLDRPRHAARWQQSLRRLLPATDLATAAAATGLPPRQLRQLADRFSKADKPLLIVGGVATAHRNAQPVALLGALLQGLTALPWGGLDFAAGDNYHRVGSLLDLQQLGRRLAGESIGVLFVSRCNPLRHSPATLALQQDLAKASLRVGLADLNDETTAAMDLVLPLAHSLESWGDSEPRRGITGLLQPLRPVPHQVRSEGDILLQLLRQAGAQTPAADWESYLQARWKQRFSIAERRQLLEQGFVFQPQPQAALRLNPGQAAKALRGLALQPPLPLPTAVIAPSIRSFDGRSRNLQLLSEIPDPLTTISYGAWVSVSGQIAARHHLRDGGELQLRSGTWTGTLPVRLQPGLASEVVTLPMDSLAEPTAGLDPATGEALRYHAALRLSATGRLQRLPILAGSPSQQGRGLIPKPLHRDKEPHPEQHPERASLYPPPRYEKYRWTMAIDLQRCVGCSACVAACYIENNVPVVGASDHLAGREMSWLRIEPFYDEQGRVDFLPMLCQHCDYAPCEAVCPVYAAYHNPEGLNVQVYNRCVGTRYCSNNCPYKVRRFNWWQHRAAAPRDRLHNPDLPRRTKGMMEKCTFCLQRIRIAKDRAKDENRLVQDGEATPACAQSRPAGAIVFGNLLDKESRVYRLVHSKRAYRVFAELGTDPAVHYLRPEY